MKKIKKVVILLLALVMCAFLTACGGESSDSDSGRSGGSTETDSGTASGPTDDQISKLKDAYNQVAPLYNEVVTAAQENGWDADEAVNTELQIVNASMEAISPAVENGDYSNLEGVDFDALPDSLLELVPGLQALNEKVATPYEGNTDSSEGE